jgi:hypothetical protein
LNFFVAFSSVTIPKTTSFSVTGVGGLDEKRCWNNGRYEVVCQLGRKELFGQ